MAKKKLAKRERRVDHHRDGTVRARGWTRDGKLDGYWEWFRLDGTRLRAGSFAADKQVGEWTTYDKAGEVVKITKMPGA